ncbi:hypothetical protein MHYP_G00336440 [Metynnis hypsauchen]
MQALVVFVCALGLGARAMSKEYMWARVSDWPNLFDLGRRERKALRRRAQPRSTLFHREAMTLLEQYYRHLDLSNQLQPS